MTGDYDVQVRQQLAQARAELEATHNRAKTLVRRLQDVKAERDGAYRERAHLVAWLAALHPAVITPAPDTDEPGWQILYLQVSPHCQASWHIAPSDADLFKRVEHVPADDPRAQWDGHTTAQKYNRIRHHTTVVNLLSGGHAIDPATRAGAAEARIAAVRIVLDTPAVSHLIPRLGDPDGYERGWAAAMATVEATLGGASEIEPTSGPCPGRPGFCRPCRTIHAADAPS